MRRSRFRLLSLMIVVAMIALVARGYVLRRRAAESDDATKLRAAESDAKANQHHINIIYLSVNLWPHGSFRGDLLPGFRPLDQTPQDSERNLRHLEEFYGDGLTESDLARRDLTRSRQAAQMLLLLWIRYEAHLYFKYRRAAISPWLPVDPDPPVPPLGPYPPPDDKWWRDGELQAKIAEYRKTFPNRVPE